MDISALTATKLNRQIKFVIFAKNKAMVDGRNAQDNFVENGSIKIVINTYKHGTAFSQQTIKRFITVHFVDVLKKEGLY